MPGNLYPEMFLILFLIGSRRIAYYQNGFFVTLPKWIVRVLFIVPFKSNTINICALVWQIPANILVLLYLFHLLGIDLFEDFINKWSVVAIIFTVGIGSIIVIYCIVFELLVKNRKR